MHEGLKKKGFVFIEALSPCPTLFSRRNKRGDGIDELKNYKQNSIVKHGAETKDVGLTFDGKIVVGKFVDRERPTWLDAMNDHFTQTLGSKYVPYGG